MQNSRGKTQKFFIDDEIVDKIFKVVQAFGFYRRSLLGRNFLENLEIVDKSKIFVPENKKARLVFQPGQTLSLSVTEFS